MFNIFSTPLCFPVLFDAMIDLFRPVSRGEEKGQKCFRGTAEQETRGLFGFGCFFVFFCFPGVKPCWAFPAIHVFPVMLGVNGPVSTWLALSPKGCGSFACPMRCHQQTRLHQVSCAPDLGYLSFFLMLFLCSSGWVFALFFFSFF